MDPLAPPPAIVTTSVADSPSHSPSSSSSSPSSSPSALCQKLRLMCSYGGHIVPRPLDKTLCYAGGESRIIAIDRRSAYSLTMLTTQLSKSLMNGRAFCLKYQLPNHDLDSLITISTEEDLANMIEEYDRLAASGIVCRLRFFLFPIRSESGVLHDPTSEDWFIDALKNVGVVAKGRSTDSAEGQGESEAKTMTGLGGGVFDSPMSLPDSIRFEKNSSFGSTGSSASAANSPAIRGGGGDEGVGVFHPDFKLAVPLLDYLGSDSCCPSPNYSPHNIVFQDAFVESKVVSANLVETESSTPDHSPRGDMQSPMQVPGYILAKPMDKSQQQMQAPQTPFLHPTSQSHYVTQYYPSSVSVASYTPMYHPYVHSQQTVQYQVNKPQPVYMMHVGQTQNPYDMSMQCSLAPSVASQVSTNPVMVAASMAYEGYKQATPAAEYATQVYITTPAVAAQTVNVPSEDHHHQVLGFSPASQPPAQSVANVTPLENANYIVGEYEDSVHSHIYQTQPQAPVLPSQLQLPGNAATMMLTETLAQLHVDNAKH